MNPPLHINIAQAKPVKEGFPPCDKRKRELWVSHKVRVQKQLSKERMLP